MSIIISLCWDNPFIFVKWPSWFLVILLTLKSALSNFNIPIPAFFWSTFVCSFLPFAFHLFIPLYAKCFPCKLCMIGFYLQSFVYNLCLLIRVFSQCILDVIMDIFGFKSSCCFLSFQLNVLSFSFLLLFWWVIIITFFLLPLFYYSFVKTVENALCILYLLKSNINEYFYHFLDIVY